MITSLSTRFGLLALLLAPVLAFSPVGDDSDGGGKCAGCKASGAGEAAWAAADGGYVKVSVSLQSGICDWSQEHQRCLEADCQTSGLVTWYLKKDDVLTLPGGKTVPMAANWSTSKDLPITKVDCGGELAYTASCSLGSFTVNMVCTECQ